MKKVIILGSSRNDGHTAKLANRLTELTGWRLINLNDYQFGYYDYEHQNRADDYYKLIHQIIVNYDTLIFATPVYWYAMSGQMKVFFDRLTDLLSIHQSLGRQLRGKKMAAISSSNGDHLGEQFWLPFKSTAAYLGMDYLADLHTLENQTNELDLRTFVERIERT